MKFYAAVTTDQVDAIREANARAMAAVSRTSDPKVTPFAPSGASGR